MIKSGFKICAAALLPFLGVGSAWGQGTDWPSNGNDPGAMRYSPLTQINRDNVSTLVPAWTYHMIPPGAAGAPANAGGGAPGRGFGPNGPPGGPNGFPGGPPGGPGGPDGAGRGGGRAAYAPISAEAMPLVIKGVMYLPAGNRIVALEPETGKEIWSLNIPGGTTASERGVSYWPGDKDTPPQILFGTANGNLIAVNATTGKLSPGFGTDGVVDLKPGVTSPGYETRQYGVTSPPAIYKNVVITGSRVQETPGRGPRGDVRGWDVHTGKLLWTFHSVPLPGEPGHETWEDDGWKDRSGANVWGNMTVDEKLGIVYLPFGQPSYDFYGGDRKGDGRYGSTLVALDAATGKLKWFYQTVHHDIWDYDLQSAPVLIDLTVQGKKIPAVVQFTKTTLLWMFDRRTGKPIYGVKEVPVVGSDVPTEKLSKTQPMPVKPLPLGRVDFKPEDLATVTPEHAAFCKNLYETSGKPENYGMYTPWLLGKSTINFPAQQGGGNWGGGSADPKMGYGFYVLTNLGGFGSMQKGVDNPADPGLAYTKTGPYGAYSRFWNPANDWPCSKPPWGELVAVNLNTGDIAWRTPLGIIEELEQKGIHGTGTVSMGGNTVTAGGLVFVGATNDSRFRAFDSKTGKELWVTKIPAGAHAAPVTFQGKNGKQYVVIMAGGGTIYDTTRSDSLIAYALP